MLFSIVVPVYNGEKKIARCLESLMHITEECIEFLIVNDGSTDRTSNIIQEYVKKDPRICLIEQKNGGVSKARNKGIELSRGKYICFVDADDEVTIAYNEILKVTKEGDYDFIGFDYFLQTQTSCEKKSRYLLKKGENDKISLYNNFLTGTSNNVWSNIYRADIIKKYQLHFDTTMKMGEDSVFNANYICHCTTFFYIDIPGYIYFYDDINTASYKKELSYLNDFAKMYEGFLHVNNLCDNLNFPEDWEAYFWQTYEILKIHGRKMNSIQNKEFRTSRFYKKIVSQKNLNWKNQIRKWFIKNNIYKIFLP